MSLKKDLQNAAAWESELNKERAGALGLTAKKLETLLDRCTELGGQIDGCQDPALKALLLTEYRQTREESERQRWNLCVQREAMGVRRHEDVDQYYPIARKR